MTVQELIDQLCEFPPDALVFVGDEENEPELQLGDFPELFSERTEYKEYVRIKAVIYE